MELILDCTATPDGDIKPALEFATTQLSPKAFSNANFLERLEKTMALLVYPRESLDEDLAELIHPKMRRELAQEVNSAILAYQCDRRDSAIRHLVRMRSWAETSARDQKLAVPETFDMSLWGMGRNDENRNGFTASR